MIRKEIIKVDRNKRQSLQKFWEVFNIKNIKLDCTRESQFFKFRKYQMHPSSGSEYLFSSIHSEFEQTKIGKTLLVESLSDNYSQQFEVSIPYDSLKRQLDIGYVLHQIFFEILNPAFQYQVFYFSNQNGCFCFADIYPFTSQFLLDEEFIPKDQIFIAYRKIVHIDGHQKPPQSNINSDTNKKKRRINDRTIFQTLQKVSLWRSKCQQKKITYQQAAKQIDIPKKTLDDYYALIRSGERFGFDFQKNYTQKIGVLRQFVKERQKQFKDKNQKNKPLMIKSQESWSKGSERKLSIIDKMMFEDDSGEEE